MSAIDIAGVSAKKVAFGTHTTVAADDNNIDVGLATCTGVVATLGEDPVIGEATFVTAQPGTTAGTIRIKTWEPTASGDTTPTAATTFGKTVHYVAWGT